MLDFGTEKPCTMPPALIQSIFQFVSVCDVIHHIPFDAPPQTNPDQHLIHIINGRGSFTCAHCTYPIAGGTVISVKPFTEFTISCSAPFRMINIHYRLWLKDKQPVTAWAHLPILFNPEYFPTIVPILEKTAVSSGKNYPQCASLACGIVYTHYSQTRLLEPKKNIRSDLLRVYEYLCDPDRTVFCADDLAALSGMSISQINRLFRKIFHTSPRSFWEQKRLTYILSDMRTGSMHINEITDKYRFTDTAHFSKWFKKHTGSSPAQYQKKSEAIL